MRTGLVAPARQVFANLGRARAAVGAGLGHVAHCHREAAVPAIPVLSLQAEGRV